MTGRIASVLHPWPLLISAVFALSLALIVIGCSWASEMQFRQAQDAFSNGNYRIALTKINRATDDIGFPKGMIPTALFLKAQCYDAMGKPLMAATGYKLIVERHPESKEMPFAKARLIELGPASYRVAASQDPKSLSPPPIPEVIAAPGAGYYVIPVHGRIGKEITAHYLDRCFKDAQKRKAKTVILHFRSPGGEIVEVPKILNTLRQFDRSTKIIGYIDEAVSAAAIVALGIKEVYAEPGAVIGSAAAYSVSRTGIKKLITEKEATIWRARAREAALLGGKNPLIAEGMVDPLVCLYLDIQEKGKPIIKRDSGDRMLCGKGQLLTLTGIETVKLGMAKAIAKDIPDIGTALGYKGWVEIEGYSQPLLGYRLKIHQQLSSLEKALLGQKENARGYDPRAKNLPYQFKWNSRIFTPAAKKLWDRRSLLYRNALQKLILTFTRLISLSERLGMSEKEENYRNSLETIQKIRATTDNYKSVIGLKK